MDIKLNSSVSSAMIKGISYNVLEYGEYIQSKALLDMSNIAVAEKDDNGSVTLYPYRGEYVEGKSTQPGIYSAGSLDFEVFPKPHDEENYKNIPIVTISS